MKKDVKKDMPVIDRETQIAIMRFFLKTSIPRILKSEDVKNKAS